MNADSIARRVRRAKTLAEARAIIQEALDAAQRAGTKDEQNQQWLRDTTGPRPRIRITS